MSALARHNEQERTYTAAEAARLLGIPKHGVYDLLDAGKLHGTRDVHVVKMVRRQRMWEIPASAITAHLAAQAARPGPVSPSPRTGPGPLPYAPYMAAVSEASGIPLATLTGRGRVPDVVAARGVLAYLLHTEAGYGVSDVGRLLDRDHATVIHAIAKVRERPTYEARWVLEESRRLLAKRQARKERVAG